MDSDTRLERLQELITKRFGGAQSAAATGLDVSPTYLSDVLRGRRKIGEQLARRLEQNAGLAPGWLDKPRGAPRTEELEIVVNGRVVATMPLGAALTLRPRR